MSTFVNHIIETTTDLQIGVVIKSVQFSPNVRHVVLHTAIEYLKEMNPDLYLGREGIFLSDYRAIKKVAEAFNTEAHTPRVQIVNAVRVLDLRIKHCNNKLNEGIWESASHQPQPFVDDIVEQPYTESLVRKSEDLMAFYFVGSTMDLMRATRQILVDSLITISPEFE